MKWSKVMVLLVLAVAGLPCVIGRGLRKASQEVRRPFRSADSGSASHHLQLAAETSQHRQTNLEWLSGAESNTLLQQQVAVEALATEETKLVATESRLEAQQTSLQSLMQMIAAKARMRGLHGGPLPKPEKIAEDFKSVPDKIEEEAQTTPTPESMKLKFWNVEHVLGIGIYLVQVLIAAVLYVAYLKHSYPKLEHDDLLAERFQFSLMDVRHLQRDAQICVCAWFCCGIRWADTVSSQSVKYLRFWQALLIFELLFLCQGITLGVTGLVWLTLVVVGRQKIRQNYRIVAWTLPNLLGDILVWALCAPCAVAQEARQVEFVEPYPILTGRYGSKPGPDGPLPDPAAPMKESWAPQGEPTPREDSVNGRN